MLKVLEIAFCCSAVMDMKHARDFYEGHSERTYLRTLSTQRANDSVSLL